MSKIVFKLGTDNSEFKKGLRTAEADAKAASGRITAALDKLKGLAAGIAVFAGIKEGIHAAMEEASNVAALSDNLGISTDSIQALDYAARNNGATMEQLSKALEGVALRSQDLIDGNQQVTQSFAKLGLRARDFIGLGADEKLAVMARAFAGAADRGAALNAVADILGAKVGPKLIATLDDIGGRGIPGITASAREAGQVIDEDVIRALDKLDDRLSNFGKRGKAFFADVLDHVITFAQVITKGAPTVVDDLANEKIARHDRDKTQREASRQAEIERAKKARETAKDKAAAKRDAAERSKLDSYIRQKGANEDEAERQRVDSLTPEQKKVELARKRLALEQELSRLPRNVLWAETKREEIRAHILKITEDEKRNNKEIADSLDKQREKLKDIKDKIAEANKKVAETKRDAINAQFDLFRFSLGEAASGKRGSGRAKGNAKLIEQKENQARTILDRNNLQFGEDGQLRYVPAEAEAPEAIAQKNKIAQTQTLPRLQRLMGGAANLRAATANLDRKDQDPAAQARKAYKEALDDSENLKAIKSSLEGKFVNQGGGTK